MHPIRQDRHFIYTGLEKYHRLLGYQVPVDPFERQFLSSAVYFKHSLRREHLLPPQRLVLQLFRIHFKNHVISSSRPPHKEICLYLEICSELRLVIWDLQYPIYPSTVLSYHNNLTIIPELKNQHKNYRCLNRVHLPDISPLFNFQ